MQDAAIGIICWAAPSVVAAIIGAAAAYATAFAADVAETLPEDGHLLPEMGRALLRGGVANGGRLRYGLVSALICAAVPLLAAIPLPVLAVLIALAVPASVMDARLLIIPEEFTWALLFAGALLSPWHFGAEDAVVGAAIACGVTWMTMTLMEYRTGLPMRSGGDIAAAAAGGAWVGMASSGVYVMSACVIFTVCAALSGALSEKRFLPMGPALLAAIPVAPVLNAWIETFVANGL
ncbi:prepilin peptidase [Rhizobium sp. BK176]|uniref:prepilin peptidase n=1 Tax=Rhizobium sp. BK176 TaxID=2587071 RepID=UPI002166D1EA|nr:prepilin peptidase [Rhizobium sp. BK176]MCS4089830.1 prepilin signal peptidase PulO-like enzyme (type II secretory pathway) [Rhizobium sp. BK176]